MTTKTEIIVLYETGVQSLIRDIASTAMFVSLIGIGVLLESAAMQWVGAIIGFLTITTFATRMFRQSRYTIEQARKRIDEIEAGR